MCNNIILNIMKKTYSIDTVIQLIMALIIWGCGVAEAIYNLFIQPRVTVFGVLLGVTLIGLFSWLVWLSYKEMKDEAK